MNQLMNSIDAIKQKITDAEYKDLCDKMMELNTQRKTTTKFYRVWYVITKTNVQEHDDDESKAITQYYPEILNKIIKLKTEDVERMKRNLDERGRILVNYKRLELSECQEPLPVITKHGVFYISAEDEDNIPIIRIDDME